MKKLKIVKSGMYNYIFNRESGFFARWGKNTEDDPVFSPYGPEIADIEIVQGDCKGGCDFCYKANGEVENKYMDLETYKKLLSKMPENLCQIAFGITDIDGNPDFFEIMAHTKSKGIIPNYTTHGLDTTPEVARKTKELGGAVAISIVNKQKTYDAVKLYSDAGINQVNIHYMLSEQTYDRAFEIIKDAKNESRLEGLNAIVFLSLKQKGRGGNHTGLSFDKYRALVDYALLNDVGIGFDSCSAPLFLAAVKDRPEYDQFEQMTEPCEAYLFSIYINTWGECTPCSFLEDEGYKHLNILECEDFLKDIWYHPAVTEWRKKLLSTEKICSVDKCRMCPHFNIYGPELYKKEEENENETRICE